jgi:hypothetical protein
MAQVKTENIPFLPRPPTPQERADELLQRWRLARAAGVPAHLRLEVLQ